MRGSTILGIALVLALGASASAQPQGRCTRETLSVQGTPLTAALCVTQIAPATAGHDLPVHLAQTFSTSHGSFAQEANLRFIAGEESSRVIEDVPLERLGLQGTLHLTLVLSGEQVRIEGAMLTPGAITVK